MILPSRGAGRGHRSRVPRPRLRRVARESGEDQVTAMRLKPGRVRKKLAEMLERQGLIIDPQHIDAQEGPLYRNPGNDLARWFCCAAWRADLVPERGLVCSVHSWDRMSDCVRYGFELSKVKGEIGGAWRFIEVSHKGEKS